MTQVRPPQPHQAIPHETFSTNKTSGHAVICLRSSESFMNVLQSVLDARVSTHDTADTQRQQVVVTQY